MAYAIRAMLDPEKERTATPIIDESSQAKIYLTPSVSGFFPGLSGKATGVDEAVQYLIDQMNSFPYESQMVDNDFYQI